MKYPTYHYLWPPRPEGSIPSGLIPHYERLGWICQIKKNGTCLVLFMRGSEFIVQTRHNSPPKAWMPKPDLARELTLGSDWTVVVAELLHHKTPCIKDTLYLFDLLVDGGEMLAELPLIDRLARLQALFPRQADCLSAGAYAASDHIWVARTYTRGFGRLFESLHSPEDEGIVIKDPTRKLGLCLRPGGSGQIKVLRCKM